MVRVVENVNENVSGDEDGVWGVVTKVPLVVVLVNVNASGYVKAEEEGSHYTMGSIVYGTQIQNYRRARAKYD